MTEHLINQAKLVAENWVHKLIPFCEKIEVAGSIRRKKEKVKDIEIVAIPKYYDNLFGEKGDEDELLVEISRLLGESKLVWRHKSGKPVIRPQDEQARAINWGRRFIPLIDVAKQIPIDIFIVRPPSNYFWQLVIRTGPAEFSKFMVNVAKRYGWRCHDGAVWLPDDGDLLPERTLDFTSEKDVFERLRIPYRKPEERI